MLVLSGGVATLISLTVRDFDGEKVHSTYTHTYFSPKVLIPSTSCPGLQCVSRLLSL